jgi:hypothetical protein
VILDLDAHPARRSRRVHDVRSKAAIGSISHIRLGAAARRKVDEVFAEGADDARYLVALGALIDPVARRRLRSCSRAVLMLRSDRLGKLALTLEGARERDLVVADWLERVPSVWHRPWVFRAQLEGQVGTYLISRHSRRRVADRDPMMTRFCSHRERPQRRTALGGSF